MIYFWTITVVFISCVVMAHALMCYECNKSWGMYRQRYLLTVLLSGSTLFCSLTVLVELIKDLL